ncbi:MAG: cell division protein SepF [Acidimicrobiales bacterium]
MASFWKKTMLYLGLGPDDEYEDDVEVAAAPQAVQHEQVPAGARVTGRPRPAPTTPAAARPAGPRPPQPAPPAEEPSAVRTLSPPAGAEAPAARQRSVVRPVPAAASAKPHVVSPTSFNHAQEVADKFKASQPVILNLQGVDRDLARRLIDFSSGLCYGLGGHMEKVAHQVYLLTPSNVEVSAEERRRLRERGLHDA